MTIAWLSKISANGCSKSNNDSTPVSQVNPPRCTWQWGSAWAWCFHIIASKPKDFRHNKPLLFLRFVFVTDKVVRQGTHVFDFSFTIPTGYSSLFVPICCQHCAFFYKLHWWHLRLSWDTSFVRCPMQKHAIDLQGESWKDRLHGGGQAKQELEDDTYIREGTQVCLQSHSKPSVADGVSTLEYSETRTHAHSDYYNFILFEYLANQHNNAKGNRSYDCCHIVT